jgi:hypothetical protein
VVAGAGASQPEAPPPAADPALPLLSEVRFREDYRCFTAGQVLTFVKGVNLLVGEQGTGKSTLISLLRDRVGTKFKAELSYRVMDVVMQPCYVRWRRSCPRQKGAPCSYSTSPTWPCRSARSIGSRRCSSAPPTMVTR